jgi:hypothetical protein
VTSDDERLSWARWPEPEPEPDVEPAEPWARIADDHEHERARHARRDRDDT